MKCHFFIRVNIFQPKIKYEDKINTGSSYKVILQYTFYLLRKVV